MDICDDLAALRGAARDAGAVALRFFRSDLKTWTKGHDDPVSEADIAVDKLLHERLSAARPAYGWLSEETEDNADRLTRRHVWIVDPIDGTRAYIEGRPEFTIAAAMVEDGRPKAAVVFNPATDEFFEAFAGGGARLNGRPISVSGKSDLNGARFLASSRTVRRAVDRLVATPATFDSVNSVAYRLALVAAGRYDATMSFGNKSDWDLAAADLIVTEAGGILSDTDGNTLTYNGKTARHPSLIGAGPAMHGLLHALINSIEWPSQ